MCVCVSSVLERHMLWSDFSVVLRQCKYIEDIVHYYCNFDKHVFDTLSLVFVMIFIV